MLGKKRKTEEEEEEEENLCTLKNWGGQVLDGGKTANMIFSKTNRV